MALAAALALRRCSKSLAFNSSSSSSSSSSSLLRHQWQHPLNDLAGANVELFNVTRRWATKRAGGSSKNGRDSESKRLGVKKFGGEEVISGNIIIRQRGTKYHPGRGVGIGKDHTIFATRDGFVRFWYNVPKKRQEVSVNSNRYRQRTVKAPADKAAATEANATEEAVVASALA